MRNPKFLGVYSENTYGERKSGALGRGSFYFVWELDNSTFVAQKLDKSLRPGGPLQRLSSARLKSGFTFEPTILAAPITQVDLTGFDAPPVAPARKTKEFSDASLRELEKARKIKQVETDLRDNFNKAMRALNRPKDRKGALAALEQVANTTAGIVPEHKHMFRDFGVTLRKKSLPDLALQCARRVVELAPNDDHAHFNMARILGIMGLYNEASAHLARAMELDSKETVYKRLQNYLDMERE